MKIARRACTFAATVAVVGVAIVGCSSDSEPAANATAGGTTTCADATAANASAEELVDVLRPVQVADADDEYRSLLAQFEAGRADQVARLEASEAFRAVPAGGDAEFVKAVCSQSRWDDVVDADGKAVSSPRSQRAAIAATGHTYCDAFAQLQPSAAASGAWTDWSGYVDMMTQGGMEGTDEARLTYEAARKNLCPQFS